MILVEYPAVVRDGENILLPTSEGNVQDASHVDRYGKPDLMTSFAEEYLRQFNIVMPTGRLPGSLKEIMPPLLLLVTAAELSLKAYITRYEREDKVDYHTLYDLYRQLNEEHRDEVERHFATSTTNISLQSLGMEQPDVSSILKMYSAKYLGGSNVYINSRYYAEPNRDEGYRGPTPYPIFLPEVVRSLIDTYRRFAGPDRLVKLGADILGDFQDRGPDNHGHWGLVPCSLGLVVISIPQHAGIDAKGTDLEAFRTFKREHPTGFSTAWMYGGNTLLFYRDAGRDFIDSHGVLDGLEYRLWSKGRLGMHSRDVYKLADILDGTIHDALGVLNGGLTDRFPSR